MLIWTDGGSKTVWRVYWPTVKFCRSDANNDDWHRQTGSLQRGEEETDESVTDDLIVTRPERKEKTEKTKLYRYLVSVLFTKHLKNEIIGSKHVVEVLSLSAPLCTPPTWQTWPWLSDIKLNNSSIFFPDPICSPNCPGRGNQGHHFTTRTPTLVYVFQRRDVLTVCQHYRDIQYVWVCLMCASFSAAPPGAPRGRERNPSE